MAIYSIKDLEQISNIKAHTIRIWEKRYKIIEPQRTNTNIRFYNDSDLRRILNISILIKNGIKISKVKCLTESQIGEKVLLFSQNKTEESTIIEQMLIAMFETDEHKFEHIFSNQIINRGFENTFIEVLYPLFDRIGMLWQSGAIFPAQEHFISNIVRQKLIVAIDSLHTIETKGVEFILFLPEGEWHELALLFYAYIIRKRGYHVVYLGQSVPFNDVLELLKVKKSNYLLTNISTSENFPKFENINKLIEKQLSIPLFVTGKSANAIISSNKVIFISNIKEFITNLENNSLVSQKMNFVI